MSEAYRAGRQAVEVTAYLVTRMPATYAAAYAALGQLPEGLKIGTILDAGSGAGAACLAARNFFPGAAITMMERDPAMAEAAREFLPDAALVMQDIARVPAFPPHDLVIASYSLGEAGAPIARRLWDAAGEALVIIEPGTPKGFALIRRVRDELLAAGALMAAPCPAASPCPMRDPDWCHFAARAERSSLHRRIKDGELGYEDEKFSYSAFTRQPVGLAPARIIRRPVHQPGLIQLELCTPEGLQRARVSKRDREAFRAARKAVWGGSAAPAACTNTHESRRVLS